MKNIDNFESIKLKAPKFTNSKKIIKIFILCLFFIFNSGMVRSENSLENKLLAPEINDEQAHEIALNGTPDEVKKLLQSGYDVNKVYLCSTLLNTAIKSSARGKNARKNPSYALDKIKILVEAGAEINFVACTGLSMPALHWAVTLPSELKDLEFDANKAIDEKIKNNDGYCNFPGVIAKPCGDITPTERNQIRITVRDAINLAYNAFVPQFMDIIKFLIEKGSDINLKSGTLGSSPIHLAAASPQEITLDPLQYLIEKGANIDVQDMDGNTALFVAYGSGNNDAVNILIKAGADKGVKNNAGVLYDAVGVMTRKGFIDNKGNITFEEL